MQIILKNRIKAQIVAFLSWLFLTYFSISLPVYSQESQLNILLFDFEKIGGDQKYERLEKELPIQLKNCLNQSIKTNINVERFEEVKNRYLSNLPQGIKTKGFPRDDDIRLIIDSLKVDYNYILAGRFREKYGHIEVELRLIDCQTGRIAHSISDKEPEIEEGKTVQECLAEKLTKNIEMYLEGRIRIGFIDFEMTGGDSAFLFLEKSIPTMLATGLSSSRLFKLIEIKKRNQLDTRKEKDKEELRDPSTYLELGKSINANYLIMGEFWEYKKNIRIDARCVSIETEEIILSEGIDLEEATISKISEKISKLASKIQIKIEKDFYQKEKPAKSIAVVSFLPSPDSKKNRIRSGHIRKTLARKLHLVPDLRVEEESRIIKDEDKLKICSNLGVNSLLTTQYEEIEDDLVILDVELFDIEKPTQKLYADTKTLRLKELDDFINEIVFRTLEYFKKDKLDKEIVEKIKDIKMPDIRYTKGIGIRVGASAHSDPDIFLGNNSSTYFEVFYSYRVPHLHLLGLDFEIEPSVGLDLVKPHRLINGVASANGFINVKVVFSGWQYSSLPLIISAGGGIGGQGLQYRFSPGDPDYLGDKPFLNGVLKFARNLFFEIEFSIIENFRFHALLRRISKTSEINTFETVVLDTESLDIDEAPVGKLGGYYFVFGFKYAWR